MSCEDITMTDEWNERIDRLKSMLEKNKNKEV